MTTIEMATIDATDTTTEHTDTSDAAAVTASTADAPSAVKPPVRESVTDLRGRKPTKFLADLTRAMRAAADEARLSAITQFQADVDRHTEDARAACELAATKARKRADEDITTLGEWETEEIARIRRETEEGITARHGLLETELVEQSARLDEELTRVRTRVESFQSEMDAFFQQLLQEDDPSHFATLAEQLPEPPAFDPWTAESATWTAEPAPMEIWADPAAAGDSEAAADSTASTDEPAATADPEAGMPPMRDGDFAAAEAEAAEWVATDETPTESGETTTEATDADASTGATAAEDGSGSTTKAGQVAPASTRTQVAVVGLVSVASIATFKRLLSRVPGVRGVQVASGPEGEFLFNATHDESLDIAAAVAGIQGFGVEVVDSTPGTVNARAVDPEVV